VLYGETTTKLRPIRVIHKNASDLGFLGCFCKRAGSSFDTFRYFKTRPLDVIENHRVTLLGFCGGNPVAYAHLDYEDEKMWLGICVIEGMTGRGYGKIMMVELMAYARTFGVPEVHLSVNKDNIGGRRLYEKFGFELCDKKEPNTLFYRWRNAYV